MIDTAIYELEYIQSLQHRFAADPGLIERVLYACGLLEALRAVEMPFCFKGGTSLMFILDRPMRLSTDIDVIVAPGTNVDDYIDKAAHIFPFIDKQEDVRKGRNGIEKRHFKFTYASPLIGKPFYILLDVVFADVPYARTVRREIANDLLLTTGENLMVEMPTAECLLGDKLTAVAPHTTGVPVGVGKELEIAKQIYDVGTLIGHMTDYSLFTETYYNAVAEETGFRGGSWSAVDVLQDTVQMCISIISRGHTDDGDYMEYLRGLKSLRNYVLDTDYSIDDMIWTSCKIMDLASCLLAGRPYNEINHSDDYSAERLQGGSYKRLAYVRKQNLTAYAHLVRATRNLAENP